MLQTKGKMRENKIVISALSVHFPPFRQTINSTTSVLRVRYLTFHTHFVHK